MLVAAVLLIVAILLFGSSVVIGAFGAILGFIAFTAFLAYVSYILSIDPGLVIIGIVLTIGVGGAWANWYERRHPEMFPKKDTTKSAKK